MSTHGIRRSQRPDGVLHLDVRDWDGVVMAGETFRNSGDVEVEFTQDAHPVASTAVPFLSATANGADGVLVQIDEWIFLMTRAVDQGDPGQTSGDREPRYPVVPDLTDSAERQLPDV